MGAELKTFQGSECERCGTCEKYESTRTCVQCKRDYSAARNDSIRRDPVAKQRKNDTRLPRDQDSANARRLARQTNGSLREAAKSNGSYFYEGTPCGKCGSAKRYTSDKTCVACRSASYRACRSDKPRDTDELRRSHLWTTYRITPEEYGAMVAAQGGCCAICGGVPTGNLYVDHCHVTGSIRGLLCRTCNNGLGNFKDIPVLMRAAANYIEKHAANEARQDPGGT